MHAGMSKRSGIYKRRDWKSKSTFRRGGARSRDVAVTLPPVRTLNGPGIGFPQKLSVRMKYGDSFTIGTITAGTAWYNVFRTNSIFDPDVTGIGHQPRYHDQLAALYAFYYVKKTSIKVTFHPSTDSGSIIGFVIPDASSGSIAIPATVSDLIEFPGAKYKHMSNENSGPLPAMISLTVRSKDMQEDIRSSRTAFGTSPSDAANFVVGMFNAGSVNSGGWAVVELVYDVVCSELVEPSES